MDCERISSYICWNTYCLWAIDRHLCRPCDIVVHSERCYFHEVVEHFAVCKHMLIRKSHPIETCMFCNASVYTRTTELIPRQRQKYRRYFEHAYTCTEKNCGNHFCQQWKCFINHTESCPVWVLSRVNVRAAGWHSMKTRSTPCIWWITAAQTPSPRCSQIIPVRLLGWIRWRWRGTTWISRPIPSGLSPLSPLARCPWRLLAPYPRTRRLPQWRWTTWEESRRAPSLPTLMAWAILRSLSPTTRNDLLPPRSTWRSVSVERMSKERKLMEAE